MHMVSLAAKEQEMDAIPLVQVVIKGPVAVLTLAHPPANTLSLDTLDELATAFQRVLEDPLVRVVVITGVGRLFSAGADVSELAALKESSRGQFFARKGQTLCNLIENSSKPVIAAINGRFALGGGNELAMACHMRLAEESTELGNPEVRLGLMVGWGGSQRLPRLVGRGKALELLLTGARIGAREAERIGLVNRVVPDGSVLDEALAWAEEIASSSAPALAATIEAMNTGLREGQDPGLEMEARRFGMLCENEDWHEGTQAFLEKRRPSFKDQ
jgi:enoyl-CoA hydratase/carnithine racemase